MGFSVTELASFKEPVLHDCLACLDVKVLMEVYKVLNGIWKEVFLRPVYGFVVVASFISARYFYLVY